MGAEEEIRDYLTETADLVRKTARDPHPIRAIADAVVVSLSAGGKVLLCGNGGSAADAQHFAAELVNRFHRDGRALPALALTTDASVLTSIGNDASFERVFARQVEALGRKGDVLIALSTSGSSPNVLAAAHAARDRGLRVIAFTGAGGDQLAALSELVLRVPSQETSHIQEVHLAAYHLVAQLVEDVLRG